MAGKPPPKPRRRRPKRYEYDGDSISGHAGKRTTYVGSSEESVEAAVKLAVVAAIENDRRNVGRSFEVLRISVVAENPRIGDYIVELGPTEG